MVPLKTASPPAADRALTILEEVARSTRGLRLPEIALRLGLPKSSAHSLLPRLNANTICSSAGFLRELALTRERGCAVDNEESYLGMRCIGAPVFGLSSETVAAIGMTGTTSEIHEGNVDPLAKLLVAGAKTISEAFGPQAHASAAAPAAGPGSEVLVMEVKGNGNQT